MKTKPISTFKNVLAAAQKLTDEEKQVLRQMIVPVSRLKELIKLEAELKKKKPPVRKTDVQISALTTSIRMKNNATRKKMLH